MVDWNKVGQLLHIVDKSKDHPKLASLTQAALAELDEHAADAAEEQAKMRQWAAEAKARKAEEVKTESDSTEHVADPFEPTVIDRRV